jgi:RNA polymerase sigma-70 factor, ECF subfamily
MLDVAADDALAFEELYDRFSPQLYPLCLRILRQPCDAQTVLLDIFWEVWRNRERYDPSRGTARTYLVTLTRSRAIDYLRASKRRSEVQQQASAQREAEFTIRQTQHEPRQQAIVAEHGELLHEAMESLTHAQRESLQLAYFEGLTHQEISDRTDTPLGSVKTHIRQGLIKLRAILRRRVPEEDQP